MRGSMAFAGLLGRIIRAKREFQKATELVNLICGGGPFRPAMREGIAFAGHTDHIHNYIQADD